MVQSDLLKWNKEMGIEEFWNGPKFFGNVLRIWQKSACDRAMLLEIL